MIKMKLFILCLVYFFVHINGQRIAGGAATTIEQYPMAAALLSNNGDGAYEQACGGAIISTSAILSAASCFFTNGVANPVSWWRATVGSSHYTTGGTTYIINRITTHPSYVVATRANDIAVLRTSVLIALQPGRVETAFLAGAAYSFETYQTVHAIGWGAVSNQDLSSSDQLRHVQIWYIDQQTCANRYNALGFTVTDSMVCVGWLDVGIRGQCPSDAGSPLLDNNGLIVGVFSWAEGCANSWYPAINTRVAAYTSWIVEQAVAA